MKGIVMHCRRLRSRDTKASTRPRDIAPEELGQEELEDCVVVLACIEAGDREGFVKDAAARVHALNKEFYQRKNIVVCPFVHLSNRIEEPVRSAELCQLLSQELSKDGHVVRLLTFGTHKDLLLYIRGHRASVSYFEFPYARKGPVV